MTIRVKFVGCASHTHKFGQVCSKPANFCPYFTQSTVFMQICNYEMRLAKSISSSVFNRSHFSVC